MRFYGGDPVDWLTKVPQWLLRGYAEMLPRLQAEESLLEVDRIAAGSGTLKREVLRELVQRWSRTAEGPAHQGRRQRAVTPTQDELAAMGIGVRMVPRKREAE